MEYNDLNTIDDPPSTPPEMPVDDELFEREEKEAWAKPLSQLWQSGPSNPEAEREYNRRMGRQAPYCSICLLFHTHHQVAHRIAFI